MTELWTVTKLAEAVGISDRQIRYYIADGKIKATKAGLTWVISDDEAKKFMELYQDIKQIEVD